MMNASNFEWILGAVCSPGSCLLFDVPLLAAALLAILFWRYERKSGDLS